MKHIYLTLLFLVLTVGLNAQDFNQAFGARIGLRSGVVFKRFVNDERALCGLLTFQGGGAQLTALRQFHQPMFLSISSNMFVYYGYGAHIGYTLWGDADMVFNGVSYSQRKLTAQAGVDANMGIEYHFLKYPASISIDYKPFFELDSRQLFKGSYLDIAVTISYTF
jgi:hypothetical protein